MHEEAVEWLSTTLSTIKDKPVVVLSHHAPLKEKTSHPQYTNEITNTAFATDLSHLMNKPIILWCFGHTHWACDFEFNKVRVVSNPVGYPEEDVGAYDPYKIIDLP